ncbi:signal peptide peptidase SppA [Sphingobium nicotianae]|uniref:Signal peptide peptidase SppA n=1 Tax=Sphingobium nicotianae TaxID=2782607 RepID=A0A9X1ISN2_9SPHN|nr:signal peptide peptidase SppA [Sphingobium nicotianae]MBT2188459.1 signal peptide peptidase SppA [Sphingobium nicotianae]
MSFVKGAWKLVVAIKDAMVLLFLLLFFALVYAGIKLARSEPGNGVPGKGALYLALDGPIVEQPREIDRLSALGGNDGSSEYRLRDVVHAIETAAQDKAIKAVVLDLNGFGGGGQVAMERVGAALDKVRKAGKPVLAHASYYDDDGYLLAAHASEVWLSPMGMVGVTGPGGSNLYYKGLVDKLGAKVHVYRVGTYKSAVEPYIRADQSPEAKAANEALVKAVWANWLGDVARARPKARVTDYLAEPLALLRANSGDTARTAQAAGLVDKLGDDIAFGKHVADLAGEAEDGGPGDFAAIPLKNYIRRHKPGNDGKVGVITVAGEIVDGEAQAGRAGGATVSNLIRDALADDDIKALVLRVDSPGGSAAASEDIRAALIEAKKKGMPVVVSMGNVAASGGYWVSTAGDTIFAEPATITGSIGVFGILPSFEETLAKIGVTSDGVKATALSGEPNVIGGVSPEFDQLAQASVEDIYGKFIGLVAVSRKLTPERVDEIGQGRVWDGGTAHQLRLVDRFGGIEDAIAEAARRAKLTGSAAQARYFEPEPDRLTQLLSAFGSEEGESRVRVQSSASPRDWLSYAARHQQMMAMRVVADLRGLVDGASVRADCLECRAFTPAPAPTKQEKAGWLSLLVKWLGFGK